MNFGPCAARGHPELSPVGRDNPLRERGAYCPVRQIQSVKIVSACDFVRQYPALSCLAFQRDLLDATRLISVMINNAHNTGHGCHVTCRQGVKIHPIFAATSTTCSLCNFHIPMRIQCSLLAALLRHNLDHKKTNSLHKVRPFFAFCPEWIGVVRNSTQKNFFAFLRFLLANHF